MKKTTQKRIDEIKKYILINKEVKTSELAEITGVTKEMIRRDLSYLEKGGKIIRTHGGAKYLEDNKDFENYNIKFKENRDIKDALCSKAIDFIEDGDVVYIDSSTTTTQLGILLNIKNDITIITNCLEVARCIYNSRHKLLLLGGEVCGPERRTFGLFAQIAIKKMHFDVAIFGSDGVKGAKGPGTNIDNEVIINEMIIDRAAKKILLIDSSKYDSYSKYTYAEFSDFDILITDKLSEELRDKVDIKTIIETDKEK